MPAYFSEAAGPRLGALFAVYSTVAGFAQALSSALSGALVTLLPHTLDVMGFQMDRRQFVFVCTFLARTVCLLLFLRIVPATKHVQMRAILAAIPHYVKARMDDFRFIRSDR